MLGPAAQRVSFRTVLVQDIQNAEVAMIVLGPDYLNSAAKSA